MELITINSVIQYITDDGEVFYERVLWMDAVSDNLVVFDLDDKQSFPVWKKLSDVQHLLQNKQCKLVDYKSHRLAIREEDISNAEKEDYEKAWEVIKDLVQKEPEIYMDKARAEMIIQAIARHSVYKNFIYRKLRAYWKFGKVKNALLPGNFNKGGKGKVRKSTEAKRGRPYKDNNCNNIGMNITDDVKEIFKKAYKKFYNNTQKMSLQMAYYKMLEEYFGIDIVTDSQGKRIIKIPEGDKLPSYSSFKYWYKKIYNIKETLISRQGTRDFELNHKAVLGESTSEAYNPGSMFQVDATIADIYLVSRDNRNWIIGRPVLYIVIDVFSRYIVGFYVGLEGPRWMGAMMALYNTTRNKVELWVYQQLMKINSLSKIQIPDAPTKVEMVHLELNLYEEEMRYTRMDSHINHLIEKIDKENMSIPDIGKELNSKSFLAQVADMRDPKVYLYKVEDITSNSRRVRWENAVESDGQTHTIYFLFLATVVSFIRKLSTDMDATTKKVLIVDNPFGSASAVYLWRVMFEMLKQNNFQLVSAGHNISKEILPFFDVNYIMTEEIMSDGSKKVVVSDFRGVVDKKGLTDDTIILEQMTLF